MFVLVQEIFVHVGFEFVDVFRRYGRDGVCDIVGEDTQGDGVNVDEMIVFDVVPVVAALKMVRSRGEYGDDVVFMNTVEDIHIR